MVGSETIPAVYEVLDDRFADVGGDRHLQLLYGDGRWLEGPAYHRAHRFLLFSDIPQDRVLRYDERSARVDVFLEDAGFANGRTVDHEGRFLSCEHGRRRVTRLEHDGSTRVIADSYEGEPLNSPNDVVEHPDGSVWFTDPTYGIRSDYEGYAAEARQPHRGVYRVDPETGGISVQITELDEPNGLAFADEGRVLYVTDSGTPAIWRFEVDADGSIASSRRLADADAGCDGVRLDRAGRLWLAAADGVRCLDPDGTLIGRIPTPEGVSNLEFGGRRRNVLYITATTSLFAIRLNVSA